MDDFYIALSLYCRRKYIETVDKCNDILQSNKKHQGALELKIQAMTQMVYVDDIETEDLREESLNTQEIAATPRVGTSVRIAKTQINERLKSSGRPLLSNGRVLTGVARSNTGLQRPGTSARTGSIFRTGSRSSRSIRLGSASMFQYLDPVNHLINTSILNLTKVAENIMISKNIFMYLFYHENDIRKAITLCDNVITLNNQSNDLWWWNMQKGRCYMVLNNTREAEKPLRVGLLQLTHPTIVLLLIHVYLYIDQPLAALNVCNQLLEDHPNDVLFLTQQAKIFELIDKLQTSARLYRRIVQIEPINVEALACIAVHHFYGNQPEMALLYYRRLLSMGLHTCELYCNLALCCLYGGQHDLVLSCFQRAIRLAITPEQRADIWYNISFVGIVLGDINLARRALRLCISADGSHGAALNNLAVLATYAGHFEKAKSYLNAAKSVLSESHEINYNIEVIKNRFFNE